MSEFKLPIEDKIEEILQAVSKNRATIVSGETGCGKSTMIPVHLYRKHSGNCRIICTQPRRLACKNIASRVASLLNLELGQEVGYHVNRFQLSNKETKILFVTTGMMLQYLLHHPFRICKYDYVILDEVHEREVDLDFVLLIIKCLMSQFRHFRIILMSATINSSMFAVYFSQQVNLEQSILKLTSNQTVRQNNQSKNKLESGKEENALFTGNLGKRNDFFDQHNHQTLMNLEKRLKVEGINRHLFEDDRNCLPAPIINIEVKSKFIVESFFLDTFKCFFNFQSSFKSNLSEYNFTMQTAQFIEEIVEISLELIKFILEDEPNVSKHFKLLRSDLEKYQSQSQITEPKIKQKYKFLIFLPGMSEIYYFMNRLKDFLIKINWKDFDIVILHSQIDNQENLQTLSSEKTYFILATNIAESSITIPFIGYIIDFCLTKEQVTKKSRTTILELNWVSQASCKQRRGRTGRMNNGYCFHLISKKFFNLLSDFINPEINRIPLDKTILRTAVVYRQFSEIFRKMSSVEQNPEDLLKSKDNKTGSNNFINTGTISQNETKMEYKNHLKRMKSILFLGNLFSSPFKILNVAIEPPDYNAIADSIGFLLQINAIYSTISNKNANINSPPRRNQEVNFRMEPLEFENTFFGELYSSLPCEAHLIRLIMYGKMLGCLSDCITLSSILSVRRSLFKINSITKVSQVEDFHEILERYSEGEYNDFRILVNAYNDFENQYKHALDLQDSQKNQRKLFQSDVKNWADKRILDVKTLFEIYEHKLDVIKKLNYVDHTFISEETLKKQEDSKNNIFLAENHFSASVPVSSKEKFLFALSFAFFPMIVRGYFRETDIISKEINYIQSKLKMNSLNVVKIENSFLSRYIDEKRKTLGDEQIKQILSIYEKMIVTRLNYQFSAKIKSMSFQNMDFVIEFEEQNASEIIQKMVFTSNFQLQEKSVAKLYSFIKGSYKTFVSEEETLNPFSESKNVCQNPVSKTDSSIASEIAEMIEKFTKIRYLHGLNYENALDRHEIAINNNSIVKRINVASLKENSYFVTNEINETNNIRHFCRHLSVIPKYGCLYEIIMIIFSNKENWLMKKGRVLEMISFQGNQHSIQYIYDDDDLRMIDDLKVMFVNFFGNANNFQNDQIYFSKLHEILSKKRVRFYLNELWFREFQSQNQNNLNEKQEMLQKPDTKINLIVGTSKTIQKNEIQQTFEQYAQWKHEKLNQIKFVERISSIYSARLCCHICDDRIADLNSISENRVFDYFRKVQISFLISVKKLKFEDFVPSPSTKSEVLEIIAFTKNNKLEVKEIVSCQNDHLVGLTFKNEFVDFEQNSETVFFIAEFGDVYIKFPNDTNELFLNKIFNKKEALMKESKASKEKETIWRNFVCVPCEFGPARSTQELYNHFQSKTHFTSIREFSEVIN